MVSATVTSKGQITIPAKVRQALQVESGDRVEFVEVGSGRFEVVAATHSVTELKRMFGKVAKRVFKASAADFADCLIERTAASAGCGRTMTFDVGAAKTSGMTLI